MAVVVDVSGSAAHLSAYFQIKYVHPMAASHGFATTTPCTHIRAPTHASALNASPYATHISSYVCTDSKSEYMPPLWLRCSVAPLLRVRVSHTRNLPKKICVYKKKKKKTYVVLFKIWMISLDAVIKNRYDNSFPSVSFTPCRLHIHIETIFGATVLQKNITDKETREEGREERRRDEQKINNINVKKIPADTNDGDGNKYLILFRYNATTTTARPPAAVHPLHNNGKWHGKNHH